MERIHSGKVYQLYNILQFQEVKQFSNYLAIRALTSTWPKFEFRLAEKKLSKLKQIIIIIIY